MSPSAISTASTTSSSTEYTGKWVDSNLNGRPDADEKIDFTIVVTNNGTVTLKDVEATSLTSGEVSCTDDLEQTLRQPVADLDVRVSYKCTGSHSVSAERGREKVLELLLRLNSPAFVSLKPDS